MPAIIPARIAVGDANVLINLIHVQRLGMLASLPGYEFVVPDDVILEITDSTQRSALEAALSAGHLRRETITNPLIKLSAAPSRPPDRSCPLPAGLDDPGVPG